MRVLVELNRLTERRVLFGVLEERHLLPIAVLLAHRLDDGAGVDALMDMERDSLDVKRGVFCFSCPVEVRLLTLL